MTKIIATLLVCLSFTLNTKAQTMRYFEFSLDVTTPWQDTSFIAATADIVVIDSALADIARPYSQRRFISGYIDDGNAGYNHNAGHWFLWHFIPGQWTLTDVAIEVCDGRPYSDVDADTTYWIGNLGQYCPWHSKPAREVLATTAISGPQLANAIKIYPNPATNTLHISYGGLSPITGAIYNVTGQRMQCVSIATPNTTIDLINLPPGLYLLQLSDNISSCSKQFSIER